MNDLFDLELISSSYRGYWADRNKMVWSTKQGPARPLKISVGTGHNNRYWSLSRNGYSQSIRVDELNRYLEQSNEYKAWLRIADKYSAPVASTKGYIIGSITGLNMSFAAQPRVHMTEAEARKECERLAIANKGKTFMYVEIKGTAKASGVNWS